MKQTSTPISEQRTRSDVELGPLSHEDHGVILSCQANNNNIAPPISIDAVVDMYCMFICTFSYIFRISIAIKISFLKTVPPELISVRDVSTSSDPNLPIMGGGRTQEGQTLQLQCRVFGARPYKYQIKWRLNDEDLDLKQTITVSVKRF